MSRIKTPLINYDPVKRYINSCWALNVAIVIVDLILEVDLQGKICNNESNEIARKN